MYNKMNFVRPEEDELNYYNDDPSLIKLIKNLSQKIKLTYEVVKKNSNFCDSIQYKKNLFDTNTLNENFLDPNLISPEKHIIYKDIKEEIKLRAGMNSSQENS